MENRTSLEAIQRSEGKGGHLEKCPPFNKSDF